MKPLSTKSTNIRKQDPPEKSVKAATPHQVIHAFLVSRSPDNRFSYVGGKQRESLKKAVFSALSVTDQQKYCDGKYGDCGWKNPAFNTELNELLSAAQKRMLPTQAELPKQPLQDISKRNNRGSGLQQTQLGKYIAKTTAATRPQTKATPAVPANVAREEERAAPDNEGVKPATPEEVIEKFFLGRFPDEPDQRFINVGGDERMRLKREVFDALPAKEQRKFCVGEYSNCGWKSEAFNKSLTYRLKKVKTAMETVEVQPAQQPALDAGGTHGSSLQQAARVIAPVKPSATTKSQPRAKTAPNRASDGGSHKPSGRSIGLAMSDHLLADSKQPAEGDQDDDEGSAEGYQLVTETELGFWNYIYMFLSSRLDKEGNDELDEGIEEDEFDMLRSGSFALLTEKAQEVYGGSADSDVFDHVLRDVVDTVLAILENEDVVESDDPNESAEVEDVVDDAALDRKWSRINKENRMLMLYLEKRPPQDLRKPVSGPERDQLCQAHFNALPASMQEEYGDWRNEVLNKNVGSLLSQYRKKLEKSRGVTGPTATERALETLDRSVEVAAYVKACKSEGRNDPESTFVVEFFYKHRPNHKQGQAVEGDEKGALKKLIFPYLNEDQKLKYGDKKHRTAFNVWISNKLGEVNKVVIDPSKLNRKYAPKQVGDESSRSEANIRTKNQLPNIKASKARCEQRNPHRMKKHNLHGTGRKQEWQKKYATSEKGVATLAAHAEKLRRAKEAELMKEFQRRQELMTPEQLHTFVQKSFSTPGFLPEFPDQTIDALLDQRKITVYVALICSAERYDYERLRFLVTTDKRSRPVLQWMKKGTSTPVRRITRKEAINLLGFKTKLVYRNYLECGHQAYMIERMHQAHLAKRDLGTQRQNRVVGAGNTYRDQVGIYSVVISWAETQIVFDQSHFADLEVGVVE